MKRWIEDTFEILKDVIEIEVAIELDIIDNDSTEIDKYMNISGFFKSIKEEIPLNMLSVEDMHRYYKTSNIHNLMRVTLRPKKNWNEEKIIHPESFRSILALRLEEPTLMSSNRYQKNINLLKKTYNKLNANNEKIVKEIVDTEGSVLLKNSFIKYDDMVLLHSYFIEEIEKYETSSERLRSLLYLELDFSLVYYNEMLRLTHLIKACKRQKSISYDIEEIMKRIHLNVVSIELPWLRIILIRCFIQCIEEYKELDQYLEDIQFVIQKVKFATIKWIEYAKSEKLAIESLMIDKSEVTNLSIVSENKYKKESLNEYYQLLNKEFELRWIKGRDFNNQDCNSFYRVTKDIPIEFYY